MKCSFCRDRTNNGYCTCSMESKLHMYRYVGTLCGGTLDLQLEDPPKKSNNKRVIHKLFSHRMVLDQRFHHELASFSAH